MSQVDRERLANHLVKAQFELKPTRYSNESSSNLINISLIAHRISSQNIYIYFILITIYNMSLKKIEFELNTNNQV